MNLETPCNRFNPLLLALGLAACGVGTVTGQDAVYAARVSSSTDTNWNAPFYWINCGDYSPYSTSTGQSSATNPSTPTRLGSYSHTAHNLSIGEGYGLVHVNGTQAGAVYDVQITQPSTQLTTNIIMNVGSTNCDIGGVFGATADGGWTNTTAFQAAYSPNQWAHVCLLTNWPGVTQPHIDFKYVSGGMINSGYDRTYADCIRFHLIVPGSNAPTPVRITRIAGTSMTYTSGSGARFILLKSPSLGTTRSGWQRIATNSATPGSFTIPPAGAAAAVFYAIASE